MKNLKMVATALFAGAAFTTPAFAQEGNMTGFTATALAGYDNVSIDVGGVDGDEGGFAYGIALGYDYDLGNAVVGVEAELMDSTTEAKDAGDKLTADRDIYVGVRAGFKVGSNALIYAKGGYTNAKATLTSTILSGSDELDGFRVGAGAEMSFGQAFGRIEYRYSDYGDYMNIGANVSRNQVIAGIGYRF